MSKKANPQNSHASGAQPPDFPYDETPMVRHFPGAAADCFDQVNQYGTYEVQRTADTGNSFPAIAQGLPKGQKFKIGRTELEQLEKE